jgi:hypothetical protein
MINNVSRLRTLMAKRIIFICVWTVVFFFGSAVLLGFASGLYFAMSGLAGQQPSQQTISWIGLSWAFVPMVLGPVGLVLGILGRLPDTHRKSS